MPKKKRKRKKSSEGAKQKSLGKVSTGKKLADPSSDLKAQVLAVREVLGLRGTTIYKVVMFLPLVAGCLVGKRNLQIELIPFYLIFLELILASAIALNKRISKTWKLASVILYFISVVTLLVFAGYTESVLSTVLLALCYLLTLLIDLAEDDSPRNIYLIIFSQLILMTLLVFLGFYSQSGQVFYPVLLLGVVPAMLLGAALLVSQSSLIEGGGMLRTVKVLNKKGQEVLRPGRLSQLLSLMLVATPLLYVAAVPIGLLPESFLLLIVLFYWIPTLASNFLHQSKADIEIAEKTLKLALLSGIIVALSSVYAG